MALNIPKGEILPYLEEHDITICDLFEGLNFEKRLELAEYLLLNCTYDNEPFSWSITNEVEISEKLSVQTQELLRKWNDFIARIFEEVPEARGFGLILSNDTLTLDNNRYTELGIDSATIGIESNEIPVIIELMFRLAVETPDLNLIDPLN